MRRANRRQPPRSVQFLSPIPAASCRSRRRSTDESSLTRGSARGFAVVTELAHARAIRGVPAELLPGHSLPPSSMCPRDRLPFGPAPFLELKFPCGYARQFSSDSRSGNTERRRRTMRSCQPRLSCSFHAEPCAGVAELGRSAQQTIRVVTIPRKGPSWPSI